MGGPSLTMAEVNRVMEQINRQTDNAHLIMGAAIEDTLGDRLTVTLVASRRRGVAEPTPVSVAKPVVSATARSESEVDLLGGAIAQKPVARTLSAKPEPDPQPAVSATEVAPPVGASRSWRSKKKTKAIHPELQLETITKGPFEHSEPTLRNGVDLDVPTFVRRGMVLN